MSGKKIGKARCFSRIQFSVRTFSCGGILFTELDLRDLNEAWRSCTGVGSCIMPKRYRVLCKPIWGGWPVPGGTGQTRDVMSGDRLEIRQLRK